MASDRDVGAGPRIDTTEYVAEVLGLRRNGETTCNFTRKVIETAAMRIRISPEWAASHMDVSAFVYKHLDFDPAERRTNARFMEDEYDTPEYITSQIHSLLREWGEF
jgi:hypothetical protein